MTELQDAMQLALCSHDEAVPVSFCSLVPWPDLYGTALDIAKSGDPNTEHALDAIHGVIT